ncbi:hypothetical protein AWB98_01190 [Mycolicibacterium conceptionense]|uniref:Uncharacterized protein n=1 Tax=Mycolicibacterium conceptionense TaxID=451644 RepID=A0ABX3UZG8_9MYCO|nr:hypothetical protein AWB98_01190 [Mycolicibacterium conceptionense]
MSDIEGLRGGFTLPKQPHTYRIATQERPVFRFWAEDAEGNGLRMIQGAARVRDITVKQTGDIIEYTVTADMCPPLYQYLIPDEALDPLAATPMPDDVEPPVEAKQTAPEIVQAEADLGEGFQLLGYVCEDALEIETKVEVDTRWGRTAKVREDVTLEFTAFEVGPAFEKLFRP